MIERIKDKLKHLGDPRLPEQTCKLCGKGMGTDSVWIYNEKAKKSFLQIGRSGSIEIFCKEHGLQTMMERLTQLNCAIWIGIPPIENIKPNSAINLDYTLVEFQ